MNIFTTWETHFTNSESNENFHNYEGNEKYSIKSTSSHLYISHCTFSYVTKTTISYSTKNQNSKLLVEFSSFNTCSTSIQNGGAIYFGDEGQCVLSSVCGSKCQTNNGLFGQFSYVDVSSGKAKKNHIIDCSVILTEQINAIHTLSHLYGDVLCQGVHLSNIFVNQISGIYIGDPSTSTITFSSFSQNKALTTNCIWCYANNHDITYTNIIDNEQYNQ